MRAFRQHLQNMLRCNYGQQIGLGFTVRVEKNTMPPGLTKVAQAEIIEPGSGTCSSISMQVTWSKLSGCCCASAQHLFSGNARSHPIPDHANRQYQLTLH